MAKKNQKRNQTHANIWNAQENKRRNDGIMDFLTRKMKQTCN